MQVAPSGASPFDIRVEGWWELHTDGRTLWRSLKPIRPVLGAPVPYVDPFTPERCSRAWMTYSYIRAHNATKGPWYLPKLERTFDKLRYHLHLMLIRWGVVI